MQRDQFAIGRLVIRDLVNITIDGRTDESRAIAVGPGRAGVPGIIQFKNRLGQFAGHDAHPAGRADMIMNQTALAAFPADAQQLEMFAGHNRVATIAAVLKMDEGRNVLAANRHFAEPLFQLFDRGWAIELLEAFHENAQFTRKFGTSQRALPPTGDCDNAILSAFEHNVNVPSANRTVPWGKVGPAAKNSFPSLRSSARRLAQSLQLFSSRPNRLPIADWSCAHRGPDSAHASP